MVKFTTEPQAPLTTILKSQISANSIFNLDKFYTIKIVFVDIELGKKYAKVFMTNQIIDGDLPYIYDDRFKFRLKDYHLRIRNYSPLWNVLRRMLIQDGFLPKTDDGAILITPIELKEYLTDNIFRIKGRNIHSYKNASIPGGESA